MVGDHPSLGNWDPAKGVELETQQENGGKSMGKCQRNDDLNDLMVGNELKMEVEDGFVLEPFFGPLSMCFFNATIIEPNGGSSTSMACLTTGGLFAGRVIPLQC